MQSPDPLKSALNLFGADKAGNPYAGSALQGATTVLTNKFPKEKANAYVTGLTGKWTPPAKVVVGGTTFPKGVEVPWTVRIDFDPVKGPHVNFAIGKGSTQTKYAVQTNLPPAAEGDEAAKKALQKAMINMKNQMNTAAGGYDTASNMGQPAPTFPQSQEETLEKLKEYFNQEAAGPCG